MPRIIGVLFASAASSKVKARIAPITIKTLPTTNTVAATTIAKR